MRAVRGGRVLPRRLVRCAAVVMFFVLGSVWTMGCADASALPQATLRFSSVQAFVKSLFADAVGLPGQGSGTASGRGGDVSAKGTRAGAGTGHAPGMAKGELPAYSPTPRKVASGRSGVIRKGFDAKTSTRNVHKSTALTDYFDNADGSYTIQSSTTPLNYKAADGTWRPIDATLVRGSDGRLHQRADGIGVSFFGGPATDGAAERLESLAPDGVPIVSASRSGSASSSGAGADLASVSLGVGESIGWQLQGAAAVTPSVSGATAQYDGILADTNLVLTSNGAGVEESLVMSSASAPNAWTFPLQMSGVSLTQGADALWQLVDGSGAVVGVLPPPSASDADVDAHTGVAATTHAVSYALATVGGVEQLTMTLDPAWLSDPARVFPVTVDPTIYVSIAGQAQSTYVTSAYKDQNELYYDKGFMKIGYDQTQHTIGFVDFPSQVADTGWHVTAAQFAAFDQHAWNTSSSYGYSVYPAGGSWSPSGVTWNNQPSYIGSVLGTWNGTVSKTEACNQVSGRWEYTNLDANYLTSVATDRYQYWGFELLTPSETSSNTNTQNDPDYWKVLDSSLVGSCSPYLQLTYTTDVAPQINVTSMSPASGFNSATLTPVLSASGTDADNWPSPLQYQFAVYPGTGGQALKSSGWQSGTTWTVPAGVLKWGQSYQWSVQAFDGDAAGGGVGYSTVPYNSFATAVPPPLLTDNLSQDSSGHGFDPALGNYTTSVTDAQVATVGPALSIVRDYNSLDPRTSQALGAGWSSILDSKAAEQYDTAGHVTSVTVTYPDGSQVGYGRNADGSFAPPLGRFATFIPLASGGYQLTDKNDTVYTFAQSLGSGVYGISSVADAAGRTLSFGWSNGEMTGMTSASGRSLGLTWTTPPGAAYPHVTTISTDPVTPYSSVNTTLYWNYFYSGDELASVCDPTQSCTGASSDVSTKYSYTSGSQYRSAVLDGAPKAYWPLGESSGSTAADEVLANQHSLDATYTNVTLGAAGGLAGSTASAAVFNGSSSQVATPANTPVLNTASSFSVSAWVKLNTTSSWGEVVSQDGSQDSGFFLEYDQPDGKWAFSRTSADSGSAAVTRAESSAAAVAGAWTHLVGVYDANTSTLALYMNGVLGSTVSYSGAWNATGPLVIGRNLWAGTKGGWLSGSVSDVSVYQNTLSAATVAGLYRIGTQATPLLTRITRPSGAVAGQIAYSTVTGRVTQVIDNNGGTWQVGDPSVSESAEGYRSAVMGAAPSGYWRLGDAAGASTAYNEVAADGQSALYNNVTLGTAAGPMTSPTAGVFDGSTSYVSLPQSTVPLGTAASVALWFNTSHAPGVLFEYQSKPLGQASAGSGSTNYVNVYIGTDGKLHGGFFTINGVPEMASGGTVTDGKWHQAVLTATTGSGATQTLYLDGKQVAQLPGANFDPVPAGSQIYLGAGTSGTGWPALPDLTDLYFNGSIAEAAFFQSALSGADVSDVYNAAKDTAGLNPTETVVVTDPNSHPVTYEYDPVNGGRMIAQIDASGAKTTYGYDSGGFLHTVVDPNGDETITGHDARGNTLSTTTCQVQSTNICSTQYYSYYPSNNTTAVLSTPDPRNDMVLTSSDARSSSSTDPAYQTSYGYDTRGDRTSVTNPPAPGYPAGRTATTTYTDGTTTYPASGYSNSPFPVAVPAGLPWTQTSAGGAVTQYRYYADGDVYSTTDPAGLLTCDSYDGVGRLTTKTEIYTAGATCASPGSVTSYTYDGLGHVVKTVAPATTDVVTGAVHTPTTTSVYNADGDLTSTSASDPTGGDATRTSTLRYNSLDQAQTSTDPAQATTTYTYNALGLKSTVQNAAGDTTAYTYDIDGRLTYTMLKNYTGSPSGSQAAADLIEEARSYDPAGRLASVTDAMGYATLYRYTDNGLTAQVTRCSAMTITGGVPVCTGSSFVEQSSTYDGAGNQVKQVTNNGTTETDYTYDAAGRGTSTTLDPGGLKRTTTKSYTADDFVASQTTGDANGSATTDYTYTPTGVMTSQSVENYTTGSPTGWWKLNDGAPGTSTPSTARDWSGQNNTATLNSGVSWASGAASFNGTSSVINTAGPVLNTAASYSISAWVNLASTTQDYQTLVGQSSADGGNVYLEYSPTFGGWSFILRKADNSATGLGAYDYASSTTGVAANTWTHLTAVYSASTGAMQLYVNGALAATATDTTPWLANGLTNIGATANASFTSNYTDGQIANVQLYPRALSATDVSTLYTGGRTGAALSAHSNTTTWQVDPRGLATSMTDADGNATSYVYDAGGSKVQTIAPAVTTGSYNTSTGTYSTAVVAPVSSTGYDTFGDVAEAKDPDGNTAVYTYDADGRETAATLPSYTQPGSTNHATIAAAKTVTHYNALGQVDKSWDAAATETDYAYDQLGHQTSATFDPTGLNRTAASVYDADGDVLKTTDPTGAIQASTYDYLGRQLTATQVLGIGGSGGSQIPTGCQTYNSVATQAACTSTSQYTDTAGFLSQTTSPAGVTTGYGYDAAGERTSVTDGANQKTTSAYDYAGRAVKTTAPDGTSTAATYDPAGQQTATGQYDSTGNLLRTATASYDGDGNLLSSTDADANALIAAGKTGYSTTFTYDATGLLQSETQPASYTNTLSQVPSVAQSITTSFGYDAAGHQTQYVTGNGNASYTTYNAWGMPESQIEPTTATYTTAAASTTTLVYDTDGRAIEQDAPGGVTTLQTYDTAGETLTQSGTGAEAATATRSFTYYNNGLVKTAATSNTATSGSNATSESFAYDDSGALTNASGSAGTSAFTYTADGQMASRADTVTGTVYTTGYGYDSAGRLSTLNDPLTGATDSYGYTPNSLNYTITYGTGGDVRSLAYNTAHELVSDTLTSGTSTVASIGYGYDPNGNETAKTTTGFTGAAANTYTYDQAGRLKSWSNGTTVTGYSYDKDSNRTQVGANVFTYDARDQLTSDGVNSYAYTPRGTLQTTTSTANGTVATTADAYGQIQSDGAAAYTYDALGRVTTSGITAFDYSGTGNTLSYDGTTTYARNPAGNVLSDLQPGLTGRVDWTDQHTDVVGYIAPTGSSLAGSVAYDPLGQVLSKTGHQTSLGYQSEYTTPTTGKVNMAARWYNPATGQFTSKDTQANNPAPNSANANPFAYANGNPLTGTDPTGHCAHPDGDFCADKGANAASQASAGNTTVLTSSAKPAVFIAYFRHVLDVIHQFFFALPHPVAIQPVVNDARCGANGQFKPGLCGADVLPAALPNLPAPSAAPSGSSGCNNWLCGIGAGIGQFFAGLGDTIMAPFKNMIQGEAASIPITGPNGVPYSAQITTPSLTQSYDNWVDPLLSPGQRRVMNDTTNFLNIASLALGGFDAVRALGLFEKLEDLLKLGQLGKLDSVGHDPVPAETPGAAKPPTPTAPREVTPKAADTAPADAPAGSVAAPKTTPALTDADTAAADAAEGASCSVLPHSFTGATPVLMADGTTKPIDQIKIGDHVANAVPGQTGTQTNTVTNVIVTKTDHDFVNLTVTPLTSSATTTGSSITAMPATGSAAKAALKKAAVSLAVALVAIAGTTTQRTADAAATTVGLSPIAASSDVTQHGGTLTTTFHHPFYDTTQAAFVDAQNLKPGDELQTPTGHAVITGVRLYHANTITYDLTIGALHTYYVIAGSTPVLVHNTDCGPTDRVVLGLNPYSDRLVSQLNSDPADTLPTAHNFNGPEFGGPDPNGDGRPLWMNLVDGAMNNGNTRLAITLDGVDGATTPEGALDNLLEQGRPLIGGPWEDINGNGTAWEMATLRLKVLIGKRDWSSIDWYWKGSKVEKMTPPPWAESD